MKIGNSDLANELFFIIEEGQFNLGDFQKALQMIELSGFTGASAIEFQLAYADDFYITSEPGHQIYKKREFSDEQLKELVGFSKEKGLNFVATCLSHRLVSKMASFGCSAYNVNASDINNAYIIDAILDTGLPFFISTPLATEEEIEWAVDRVLSKKPAAEFALLHGQHSMASGKEWVEANDTSLAYLQTMKHNYKKPVGFIDHTAHEWMPAVAVAAGAQVISKHLTMSSVYKGPDWAICLDPEKMKSAIEKARAIYESMQVNSKHLAKGEDLDRSVMRRSVVSAKDISKGKLIEWSDIEFKRPGTGMPPPLAENLIGKKATREIRADELLNDEMFK
ncbi:MAG TPA: N-acetylneuraminate synthase family protein [Ferruginibacter sp.]|nr:N-acetylneuraminate synthase family protein [Ferruginibacter sp.]